MTFLAYLNVALLFYCIGYGTWVFLGESKYINILLVLIAVIFVVAMVAARRLLLWLDRKSVAEKV